jgi:MoxR-like ATPase
MHASLLIFFGVLRQFAKKSNLGDKGPDVRTRQTVMFDSLESLSGKLKSTGYVTDPVTLQLVYLAGKMNRPLLVEGPAGSGKTELAYAVAKAAHAAVERLQCYEGINEAAAIGTFDAALQELFLDIQPKISEPEWVSLRKKLHTLEFFTAGPLLRALLYEDQPCVLLIDELDKVGPAFGALLLELLSEWQLSIPKLGTVSARTIPFVVLTSNDERRIGDPLRRRCFYLRFEFPTLEREREILCRWSQVDRPETYAHIAGVGKALRGLCLSKPPSISEILDLAHVLELLGGSEIKPEMRETLLPVLVKTESDRQILMMSDQWESILYDAAKYSDEILTRGETVCGL